jgi:hypothetical protein
MRKHYRFVLIALSALLMLAAGVSQEESTIELTVRAGFDGYIAQDNWIPLRVTVTNNSPEDISGELRVTEAGLGGSDFHYVRLIDLPRGTRKNVFVYVRTGGYVSALEVTLMAGNRPLVTERVNVLSVGRDDWLIGIVSDAPQTLGALGNVTPVDGTSNLAVLGIEDLPPVASTWSALDILVFSDVDTGTLSEVQRRALRAWVNDGGRLIIIGGVSYERTFAGLGDLLPLGQATDTTISLEPLAGYVRRPFPSHLPTAAPVVTGTLTPDAHVVVGSRDAPLVVGQAHGAGRVMLLAADPGLEPLRSWNGIVDFWEMLLSTNWQSPPWLAGVASSTYSGWPDARRSVTEIPGVMLPSALSLCLFSLLYVLLIGPLNYIVLRRLRRLEAAWLTVPVLAVVFTGMAYFTGLQLRGSRAIVHRVAMVQMWPESDDARISGLLGVWSPRRTRYDISLGEGFLVRPMPTEFGGSDTVYDHTLEQRTDAEAVLPGVRVDVGAVETFAVDGYVDASTLPVIRGELTLNEQDFVFTLSGRIANASSRDLRDVALLALGEVHYVGNLLAGEIQDVMIALPPRQITPAAAGAPPYPATSPYSYDNIYYDLPSDLLGGAPCYDFANNEHIRECSLLESIISIEGSSWQNQVYVVAWDEEPLMPITITNAASEQIDLTVTFTYIPFRLGEQVRRVPPTLMTWAYIPGEDDAIYPSPQPYEYFLDRDVSAAFRFEPLPDIGMPDNLDTVIVHLQGLGGSGSPPFTVALWNWERSQYTEVDMVWGNLTIRNAQPFISESGTVQVLLVGSGEVGAHINQLDVTLLSSGD